VCAAIAHQPSNTACFQLSLFLMAQGRKPATNAQVFQILPSVIGVCDNWYLLWDFDWLSDYFNCFYSHDSSSELFQYLIVKANSARCAISRLTQGLLIESVILVMQSESLFHISRNIVAYCADYS